MESLRFDASGKNGGPRFEGDRRDRQAHFVESTCIAELPGQVSTANNPDAALASGGRNVVEVVVDCTANHPDVEAIRNGKWAAAMFSDSSSPVNWVGKSPGGAIHVS